MMAWPRALARCALALAASAHAASGAHSFVAIGHTSGDEAALRQALAAVNDSAAFIAATGIKNPSEPCSDKLYLQRRELLDDAPQPVMLSLAASDWSACRNSAGRSNAIERLNRLRELYFGDANSLGKRKLPVTRQSANSKFRSYAENAYWEVGDVVYATIDLPANNNHYLRAAGRNSEYEDRLVANRFWLHRLFAMAQRRHAAALVLFSEGDLSTPPERNAPREDGFAEPRQQLEAGAKKFNGKVLLIDTGPVAIDPIITWRGNVGHLALGARAVQVHVSAAGFATDELTAAPKR